MSKIAPFINFLFAIAFCLGLEGPAFFDSVKASSQSPGVVLSLKGPIGPATSDYIHHALSRAAEDKAPFVILEMDTPGGLDTSMREIVQDILASPLPVISYVTPQGARAASAGAFIVYASHLAAMTPGTNIGAASPVQLTMPFEPTNKEASQNQTPHETKIMNDATAYIKALADLQGRNKEWAIKFVKEGKSLTAEEALKDGVINIVAHDTQALLTQAEGHKVILKGKEAVLHTKGVPLTTMEPGWRSSLLALITNPNIAFLLMIVGLYGIIFEFMNPGSIAPGVFGAICLLVALYAFHVLPVNYAGLALILLGMSFFIAEIFMPSYGTLGIGGLIAFVIGSLMLFDTDIPGFRISVFLIFLMAAASAGFLMLAASLALRSHRKPVVAGSEAMLHKTGHILEWKEKEGIVKVEGEIWRAQSTQKFKRGDSVKVASIEGLTLFVNPKDKEITHE